MGSEKVLLARVGRKDSRSIETYVEDGGYKALRTVLTGGWSPEKLTDEVKKSGLRGRGGAGFPTGVKWGFVPKDTKGKPVYLLLNADESEPGTFKDRLLMEEDPHQVIEGMILSAYALKCRDAYIYIRGEFYLGARILDAAIAEAYDKGFLGENILGSGYGLNLTVHRGAGAYICGEETGLIESLEGKRGQPRIKPPFPAVHGVFGCPTIVNNVETLACVVHIVNRGADWFAKIGRNEKNTGPKLYCLSGHIVRPGVYEAPLGLPMKELLFGADFGQGMKDGRKVKAVIPGGASAAMLTAEEIEDCPLDFDGLVAKGSMLGSAAIIVMNEDTCIVDAAKNLSKFFSHESCGQCTPCREGTPWLLKVLTRIEAGEGRLEDIDLLEKISNQMANGMTICVFADAAIAPVLSSVGKFREEYRHHIDQNRCLVGPGATARPVPAASRLPAHPSA
ncbi:MAG TPA: NADH-quinone oxidoreductase subunit NuoF [Thermoanaerobaculia bacterium]|nr:NADH-quinone oxidoreductase subunit NuoF [Thermoanaerobaculia bacterium]